MPYLTDSLQPSGLLTAYLERAQIALVVDDALFLHGAAKKDNLG